VQQRRSAECAAGGYVEVLAQVARQRPGLASAKFGARVAQAMLDSRQQERQPFGEVAEYHCQLRKTIEQTAHDQAQRVRRRLDTEAPGGANERWMPVVDALLAGERIAGVKIEWHAEGFDALPELPQRRLVEVLRRVRVADIRIAVDHRPLEAQL